MDFEKVRQHEKPDLVLLVGDVNSTLACIIAAKKLWLPVVHVEAGQHSWDMKMPDEINRIVTDSLCELFLTTDPDANANLARMWADPKAVHFAGNVMIDALLEIVQHAKGNPILERMGVKPKEYCFLTLHRPSNVDIKEALEGLLVAFDHSQRRRPIVFPAHPRTVKMIKEFGFGVRFDAMTGIKVCEPLDYHQMLKLPFCPHRFGRAAGGDHGAGGPLHYHSH